MAQAPKCKTCGGRHWSPICPNPPATVAKNPGGRKPSVSTPPAQRIEPGDSAPSGGQAPGAITRKALKPKVDAAISKLDAYQAETPQQTIDRIKAGPFGGVFTEAQQQAADEYVAKRRGRPANGFDKKAYDREQAKARRAAKKGQPK